MRFHENLSLQNLETEYKGVLYKERWKAIPGLDGYYQISSFGRVKSMLRSKRIIRQDITSKGYAQVGLFGDNGRVKLKVHRLVAIAFNPNPEDKPEVTHLDYDKTNNFYKNLSWGTTQEHIIHAQKGGRRRVRQYREPSRIAVKKRFLELRMKLLGY